jgi:hypothetical protein
MGVMANHICIAKPAEQDQLLVPDRGPGLSNYTLGEVTGQEGVTLTANNLPVILHNGNIALKLGADSSEGSVTRAANNFPALWQVHMQPHQLPASTWQRRLCSYYRGCRKQPALPIRAPYLGMSYIILFVWNIPSRN